MNKRKRIIFVVTIVILALFSSGYVIHRSVVSWRFSKAAEAAGGFPYEIGLTGATVIPCFLSCYVLGVPTCCMGGTLCMTKDIGTCTMYSHVSGSPAGGSGTMALFSKSMIGQAGLSSGGQLIAGGMSMTQMDSGVLASAGGCAGCTASKGTVDKIYAFLEKIDKYIIAGFKSK